MKKINPFDALAVTIFALVCVLATVIAVRPERDLGQDALLTIRVEKPSTALLSELEKKGTAYLNGTEYPVDLVSASRLENAVVIVVQGKGTDTEGRLTFNGQRVLINQKAELYGTFFAKGKITGLELK